LRWRATCIQSVDEFEEEEYMKRFFAATVIALGSVAFVHAQDTKTTTVTKVDGKAPQTVTYTGCVQSGTETKSFILNHVVPMSRSTTTTGTTGSTTTTTTTYALVPDQKIELETHVGHKVEVTGMMIPAGESKVTTTTKIDRENAPDSKTTETVKSNNAYPQFRVLEVKNLAESCD
jgi:UDP-N-acetylmuramyl tripeptide synthase